MVERLLVPDMALAVAEKFAVEENKRVLVLMTDMTAYADAMKEIGVAQERIPAVRGYMGDLYTQLAQRYEKACDFKGAGSVTILTVTTMPGDDVTHPVPDNTGYITEGQFYLHGGVIDPFGSLSRLKQHVVGKATREDHSQIANTMIRFYSGAVEARKKQAMAFELSPFDQKLLKFGALFRERFMDIRVSIGVIEALDLCWKTLAECFEPQELLMKQSLVDKYFPKKRPSDRGHDCPRGERDDGEAQTQQELAPATAAAIEAVQAPAAVAGPQAPPAHRRGAEGAGRAQGRAGRRGDARRSNRRGTAHARRCGTRSQRPGGNDRLSSGGAERRRHPLADPGARRVCRGGLLAAGHAGLGGHPGASG